MAKKKKLLLIDGNSLMFRSYYATAFKGNLMQTKTGQYTNALFGFCNMINKLIEHGSKDEYAFVAFDAGKQTFRHQEYQEYKMGRKPLPDELRMQIPIIKEYLDLVGIKRMENLDYEADDLLAICANKFKNDFESILVYTGDKDLLQLVDDTTQVALTKKGVLDVELYTKDNFYEKAGMHPYQIIEYKGIAGDNSDNLPGVKGIGEKTALKLLEEFDTIDGIMENLDKLTPKQQKLFSENIETALKCRRLATLMRESNLDIKLDELKVKEIDTQKLIEFYTQMEMNQFLKKLMSEKVVSKKEIKLQKTFDLHDTSYLTYEVVGQNYAKGEFLGVGLICNEQKYFLTKEDLHKEEVISYLEDEKYKKYTFDLKGLYFVLKREGIELKGVVLDVLLASYLINPSFANDDIKITCDNFVKTQIPYYENIYGANKKLCKPDEKTYIDYSLSKCELIKEVKETLLVKIIDYEMEYLLDVEQELSVTLANMELNGLLINKEALINIGKEFLEKVEELKNDIYALAGETFNINSPKQLGEILFDKLNLPHGKKNQTGYSTSVDILEKLAEEYEIVKKILDYRAYNKLVTTYVNGIIEEEKDGFIHPIYKQALTNTGRLSSVEPNIQNIPVRTELGQAIRTIFTSRFPNGKILAADYSQIELRILAVMSKDQKMIDSFINKIDIHTKTASEIFDVPVSLVTKDMRRSAKAINFGLIYGMSPWGLSETLKIPVNMASQFINKYFYEFSQAKNCLDDFIKAAKETGYSKTLFARRRYITELQSPNGQVRQFGERTAMNSPIQGTSADIIKIAMNKVYEKMKKTNMKSIMIAQVHDELVFDCPIEEVEKMTLLVKEEMKNAVKLSVPLEVSVNYGDSWFEAK